MNSLLMVPPTYYRVVYEINPWMARQRPAIPDAATAQWRRLHEVLTGPMGSSVALAEPEPELPDMVFTANAGLVLGSRVVLSRFRPPERQGEAPRFRSWFRERGFSVVELPEGCCFEGEGDALFVGDTLFAGYQWRSDVRAHRHVGEILGVRVLSLQLADPRFYHLDTCFCPLDGETVAWYPDAFDDYARRAVEAHVPRRVAVDAEEALRFACNAVVIGREVALNAGCPRFEERLRERGFTPHPVALDEFLKAGGSAKCLVLHLDRPEPAGRRGARPVEARMPEGVGDRDSEQVCR